MILTLKNGMAYFSPAEHINTKDILMLRFQRGVKWSSRKQAMHFFQSSRHKLWMKGEELGNIQQVEKILLDCDSDALILFSKF